MAEVFFSFVRLVFDSFRVSFRFFIPFRFFDTKNSIFRQKILFIKKARRKVEEFKLISMSSMFLLKAVFVGREEMATRGK